MTDKSDLTQRTIDDFGAQWLAFRDNEGYYASNTLFQDICLDLLDPLELVGAKVADIGSGTGRIVRMLIQVGVRQVIAVEPSAAFEVLRDNLADLADRVDCIQVTGDQLPSDQDLDFVFSIGVIHHIPDPLPVLIAARNALRPGGKLLIWVYGREGNELYLAFATPLRAIATRLPDRLLWACCAALWLPLRLYRHLLPLASPATLDLPSQPFT